jgi:hypothetical protein
MHFSGIPEFSFLSDYASAFDGADFIGLFSNILF